MTNKISAEEKQLNSGRYHYKRNGQVVFGEIPSEILKKILKKETLEEKREIIKEFCEESQTEYVSDFGWAEK